MPILLLVFLIFVCLPELGDWGPPLVPVGPLGSILLTSAALLLPVAYAAFVSRREMRALVGEQERGGWLVPRHDQGRFLQQMAPFLTYVLALRGFGWGWTVNEVWRWDDWFLPGADLVLLAPFFAALVASWALYYDADRAAYRVTHRQTTGFDPPGAAPAFASRAAYVGLQVRQKVALVLIPVGLLLAQKEVHRQFPNLIQDWNVTVQVVSYLTVFCLIAAMPWFIRLLLGLRPVPAGPLRARLLATARRLNFRCSDILLWNTNQGMANAMVVGIFPWLRYVVFTDRLLDEFSPAEVEAVLGHEVGHIKHQHMLYYLLFLLGSMVAVGTLATQHLPDLFGVVGRWLGRNGEGWKDLLATVAEERYLQVVPLVGCVLAYILVVFGFLSRRCERQADIYGCRAVSCARPDCSGQHAELDLPAAGATSLCPAGIRTFIRALETVAAVNGINRDRPGFLQSWQHSTIAQRVEFLQRVLADPALEARFQRRVACVKWGLFVALGVVLATLAVTGVD